MCFQSTHKILLSRCAVETPVARELLLYAADEEPQRKACGKPLLKLHIFLLQHSGEALTGGGFPALNRLQRLPGCVLRLPVIQPQTRYGD